jgi:hypothetical protein
MPRELVSRDISRRTAIEANPNRSTESGIEPKTERAAASQAAEQSIERGLSMGR